MKLGLFALPGAFLVAIAFLIVGCGGGTDTLTLEEYFAEYQAIDADVDAEIDALFADYPEDGDDLTNDANLPFFKDLVAAFPRIMGDFLGRLNGLEPPADVEDAHNDLVGAGEDLLLAFEEGADVLSEAETVAEFSTLEAELEPAIEAATTRFNDACLAVVEIAEANNIAVTITCEDDG